MLLPAYQKVNNFKTATIEVLCWQYDANSN